MRLAKATILATLLCSLTGFANAQQNRINRPVNVRERFTLTGHMHPHATAANDQGRVAASLQLSYVTLTFTRSPSQDADLQKLLADQQNPQSAKLPSLAHAGRICRSLWRQCERPGQDHVVVTQ